MKAILTSSLGGQIKVDGKRIPTKLMENNGLLDTIRSSWKENSNVLIISGSPGFYDKNDSVVSCMKESFSLSGLSFMDFLMCDDRNREIINRFSEMDVLILAGGHVPSQNAFLKELKLEERLSNWDGLLIAWSAGSMNCAEIVYAGPELPGEAIDPEYRRWISGLGITKINIFPHFEALKDEMLDGMRLIEDITYSDSMGHEIIALNNGSYIVTDNDIETLYGDAYSIKDGVQKQICKDGEWILLERNSVD
ncbi:MAG: Type 1 glutamine amidotransferase-like domain-containing protein [Lachnospiraceae bacterium]|nr:Type 1 glutamine amidotransferase-like domain-containing protein [Lachnospiraceae bacterium]